MKRRFGALIALVALAAASTLGVRAEEDEAKGGGDDRPAVESLGTVEHEPLSEISGVARSAKHGVYWVHNDSGDRPRIFAIDGEGKVVFPKALAKTYRGEKKSGKDDERKPWPGLTVENAKNVDWEELTIIGDEIFIGEMGNNGNARKDLGLYVLTEPDPRTAEKATALKFLPIVYPDQKEHPAKKWQFDCESIFGADGKVYFLTKHRIDGVVMSILRGTKLYRLDTRHTDEPNVLTLVDRHTKIGPPTACSLSPDGKHLAVLGLIELWVFDRPAEGDAWLSGPARMMTLPFDRTRQAEAVCWDDDATLRILNEQRGIFRVKLSSLKPVSK